MREDTGLLNALAAILADATLEPAFVALALSLPGEADIAREIGRDIDPNAILAARTALRQRLANTWQMRSTNATASLPTPAITAPTPPAPDGARSAMSRSISWSRRNVLTRLPSPHANTRPPTT